jgi:truncated hemoglobin YjbI
VSALPFLTVPELAEKVQGVFGKSSLAPWYAEANTALAELARRAEEAEALAEALERIALSASYQNFNPTPDDLRNVARDALARYRGEKP